MKAGEEIPEGTILNLERFAIHDGPGIRTLVFMKGCPLRCLWCSTPQSQKTTPEILHLKNICHGCGTCMSICPAGAVSLEQVTGHMVRDRMRCRGCGTCAEACPHDALEMSGKIMTVEALLSEVEKDSSFYRRSGGGVTVGGGEPTMQHRFVAEFLRQCQNRFIDTALESSLYVAPRHLDAILDHLDLLLCDIKHMNNHSHQRLTGVPNQPILDNIRMAAARIATIIRVPVIPGCNDTDENIREMALFAAGLGQNVEAVELLPYHPLGCHLYEQLDRHYELAHVETPLEDHMADLKQIVEACGVPARIG